MQAFMGKQAPEHPPGAAYYAQTAGGSCWYPVDRIPPHTSFKSRQVVGHASTRCHVSYGFGPRLSAEMGSGATTCPMAPDLTSRLRWAPALPYALQLRTSPPS
jgi:hypothetical protein